MTLFTKATKRHIAKTISWRVIGSIDTILIGYFITGNQLISLSIGGLELISKSVLYFLHERIWHQK